MAHLMPLRVGVFIPLLTLDAYMQWFHIGSYRLAGLFSQRGGLVYLTGIAYSQMGQFINSQPDTVEATAMAACLPMS